LRLTGLRALSPDLYLRPDNVRGGVEGARRRLHALGLPVSDLVFALRDLDPDRDARARELWKDDGRPAVYRRSLAEMRASAARLDGLTAERAMVESFLLGGRVIRDLVLDPLLPEAIETSGPRRAVVGFMREYDRQGRRAWAEFLGGFDVPHLATPADTRIAGGVTPAAI
jgi:phenylacetic acid degradation operon negative regulatory protein